MKSPVLTYQLKRRVGTLWTRLLVAFLIATAVGLTLASHERLWRIAERMYWQHECLIYSGDSMHVVCEERIDRPTPIAPDLVVDRSNTMGTRLAARPLRCFVRFAAACGWQRLGGVATSSTEVPVLFCHQLATPAGGARLVVVTRRVMRFEQWRNEIDFGQKFGANIFVPGSFTRRPTGQCQLSGVEGARAAPILSYSKRTRFFEGVPNPTDPSRFTIGYDMDGVPGVIEGQLQRVNSEDNVLLRVLSGPALDVSQ